MPRNRAPNTARPGLGGAIKDAVESLAKAAAPKSVTQIRKRQQEREDAAIGRMRSAQHTDSQNR